MNSFLKLLKRKGLVFADTIRSEVIISHKEYLQHQTAFTRAEIYGFISRTRASKHETAKHLVRINRPFYTMLEIVLLEPVISVDDDEDNNDDVFD